MRCFLAVLGLMLCLGCSRGRRPAAEVEPTVRLAVVTDLKGYLEPCGCTSNPLGGIDRLAAQIQALREKEAPLLVVAAGDAFYDAAPLEPARVDQANRNAKTLAEILSSLEVTAVLPGRRDRAQPPDALAVVREASDFPWLAMGDSPETLPVELGGLRLAVVGAPPGVSLGEVEAAVAATRSEGSLVLVLIDGTRRDANRIAAIDGVDFVVQGGLDQDSPIPPRHAGGSWVFHASRQGQGVTVVDVYRTNDEDPFADRSEWSRRERAEQLDAQIADLGAKIAAWEKSGDVDAADLDPQRARLTELKQARERLEAPAMHTKGNAFAARFVELTKRSPRDVQVQRLMREHDKAVNRANRIAFADLKPPPLGPDDIAYVGSAACAPCHAPAYTWWANHRHGVAYRTLQSVHKEYNLDCVGCHVTGYQKPGGSTVTHNLDRALVGVGCESCHGPGAAHAKDPEVAIARYTTESTCVGCHNEEHSDLFDYDAFVETLTVPGHGLPVKVP